VTKLLFDYGADLDFKTFWSFDKKGSTVVGKGNTEGNAIQLLQFLREHQQQPDKQQITTEQFDKVLQHLSKNKKVFFLTSLKPLTNII
jgi:hypothetical protein